MPASTRTPNHNTREAQRHRDGERIFRMYGGTRNPWNLERTPEKEIKKEVKQVDKVEVNKADILNPVDSGLWTFKTENGAIQYSNSTLNGCCGVATVYHVVFGNIEKGMLEVFYKEVEEHLLNVKHINNNMARGSLMMSDAVGGEQSKHEKGLPTIYGMCTYLGWEKTSKYFNPRSNNYIVVFMKEKNTKGSPILPYDAGDKPLVVKWKNEEGK